MRIPVLDKLSPAHLARIKRAGTWALVAVCGLLLLLLIFRGMIFRHYLHRKLVKLEQAFNAEIRVDQATVTGILTLRLSGITVKPANGDTLLHIGRLEARLKPLVFLFGNVRFNGISLTGTKLSLVNRDGTTNYKFLLKDRSGTEQADSALNRNYAGRVDRLFGILFAFFPNSLDVEDLTVSFDDDGYRTSLQMKEGHVKDHMFTSAVTFMEDSLKSAWILKGRMNTSDRLAGLTLFPADTGKAVIPYLKHKWNADIRFDTVNFFISEEETGDEQADIRGSAGIRGLCIQHGRIAAGPVSFDKLAIDFRIRVGRDYAELDSSSLVTFNRVSLHPYLRYRPKPTKQITLKIHKPEFPAQDLFSSLPEGLFSVISGIKVKGELSWNLDFSVDLGLPDSLKFDTELKRHQFSVVSFGNSDLLKINEPFLYTAYEKGIPVRTFMVGSENPDFRTIDRISPYLRLAVLGSEDAGFYQHRGFIPDAFRESFITNIKERRFARGGSTISMQLVKNVYLNRNKTIARKLEEAIIVWLIENQGLSTKDRMFEVYLNIIEWGPGIYGANEASRFYFRKDVSKLTLSEAIFMASVIPRPKWFMYSFDKEGRTGQSTIDFIHLLSGKMLKKEQITQQEYDKIIPGIELKGAAKLLLKKSDSIPPDTTSEGDFN